MGTVTAIRKKILPVKFVDPLKNNGDGMIFNTEDQELRDIILQSRAKLSFFCRTFLRETCHDKMTPQHLEMCDVLDDRSNPKMDFMAWRGFGKSTIGNAFVIRETIFRISRMCLYVGSSHDMAAQETENIKGELCSNDSIMEIFGNLAPKYVSGDALRPGFSKKGYFLADPDTRDLFAYITPKGANQKVRGLNARIMGKKCRPDLVIWDDGEDDEEIWNDDNRVKTARWFFGALLNVVPRKRPDAAGEYRNRWYESTVIKPQIPPWRVMVMDTPKHNDAIIVRLQQQGEWKSLKLPKGKLEDGKWKSCIPEMFPDSIIKAEVEQAQNNGVFDTYCREMLCETSDPEKRLWTPEMFQHYFEGAPGFNVQEGKDWHRFVVCDPARTKTNRSAYTGMIAFAVNPREAKVVLRDFLFQRLSMDDVEMELFKLAIKTNSQHIGVEDVGLNDWVKLIMDTGMRQRGLSLDVFYLKSGRANKEARAELFYPLWIPSPAFPKGHVWIEDSLRGTVLEQHLLLCPNLKWWDVMDCMAYIPKIMEDYGLILDAQMLDDSGVIPVSRYDWDEMTREIESGAWMTC